MHNTLILGHASKKIGRSVDDEKKRAERMMVQEGSTEPTAIIAYSLAPSPFSPLFWLACPISAPRIMTGVRDILRFYCGTSIRT